MQARAPSPPSVDLWCVPLVAIPSRAAALLSSEEQRRASRFRFARHRRCFVARRSALRAILSAYLGADPGDLRFETNRHGKPSLRGAGGLAFNTSH